MRRHRLAAAILSAATLAGCGGSPETILINEPMTEERAGQIRRDAAFIDAQERANLAGKDYVPRDEELERVEAEERANLATTPRR